MLTAAGCRSRRSRLLAALGDRAPAPLVLGDPLNLRYFANASVDTFSLGGDFGGLLVIRPDGHTTLYHDARVAKSIELAHVDERHAVGWYDGQSVGRGARRMILRDPVMAHGGALHDGLTDPLAPAVWDAVTAMRRAKDPDEIDSLKACMRATEAGHAWARQSARAGMTELDVYAGVAQACTLAAGHAVIVYGDFAVSPGVAKRGGPPTGHKLADGETLILDYSVVIQGYRSDFTNTLVVGGHPTAEQAGLFALCVGAMAAGEAKLKAGAACQAVYDAVRAAFGGHADAFPHHAGHGLGLSHPEAPFLVKHSEETLVENDVVTLEPGLYVDGVGGVRIEHNYRVTATGFERLSAHAVALS